MSIRHNQRAFPHQCLHWKLIYKRHACNQQAYLAEDRVSNALNELIMRLHKCMRILG